MKILALGNSDTRGAFASGPTWTTVASDLVRASRDEPVTFEEARFSAERLGSAEFAERRTREGSADLVIVPVGTFAFSVGFSWVRIQRLLGKRVAARYRKAEEDFDRRTREPGTSPGRRSSLARRIVRTVIGTQPFTDPRHLTDSYCEILRALARVESADVLVVFYPPEQGRYVSVRNYDEKRRRLIATVSAEALNHRFRVLNCEPLFDDYQGIESLVTEDGFHLERAGHALLGRAVAEPILRPQG